MQNATILWADDEIELLKPQILFLQSKGFEVYSVTNGQDAIDACQEKEIDILFLDESMPGLSGLETLARIKEKKPDLPVVMITKNEEENLMDEAIGSQISDYLIKPVKPNQILLTLKKLIDQKRLVGEKTTSKYQQEFQKIFMSFQEDLNATKWAEIYRKLTYWELELDKTETGGMKEILAMQKQEANVEFYKFFTKNYLNWIKGKGDDIPVLAHRLMAEKVFPFLSNETPTVLILIDNLRFDQWKVIQPIVNEYFRLQSEDMFYSILPTATQYARNAIFSGLLPSEIERKFPQYWKSEGDEGSKNAYEKELLDAQLKNAFRDEVRMDYFKITNLNSGKQLEDNILNCLNNHLTVIVYNFIDMLSHARTEIEIVKELARDEAAYRSLTLSWFEHSPLHNMLRKLADRKVNLMITTDHGTIRVKTPSKCLSDKGTTTNIRYKNGKNMQYNPKDVFEIKNPAEAGLPRPNVSTTYIFAREAVYFVYANNYNYYVNHFNDTFQHGGVSLEEVIVPFAFYSSNS